MSDAESSQLLLILDKLAGHFSDPYILPLEGLDRGSHHRTYVVTFASGVKRVVRISDPFFRQFGSGIVPPPKMRSEIATIKYLREHTKIPVPDVVYYDDDKDGSIGAEWMAMEYVEGNRLLGIWADLSPEQRTAAAVSIADVERQLLSLRFDSIGSLYDGGRVGPMTFLPSNNSGDTAPPDETKCGPFASIQEWLVAVALGELEYKTSLATTAEKEAHRAATVRSLRSTTVFDDPAVQDLCAVALHHIDLTPGNIIVDPRDPARIVGVIDWEGAKTVPLFAIRPRWYSRLKTLRLAGEEEVRALQVRTREAIREGVPEWYDATDERGRGLREVLRLAETSTWDPAEVQFEAVDRDVRGLS
ncbi:hypothetical protein OE88DRAFT_478242 [Heliocybe sulcata]|uniref:Aminoglycoside phosphotransferase domain-containing protein n=1 Tax=Heliocybe sulcata TaxID=5364 RepID=A0A5C3MZF0_9AGAM|nr:hypothetical protein OE88DRAFT_478242 [Heliocybe sulcata]